MPRKNATSKVSKTELKRSQSLLDGASMNLREKAIYHAKILFENNKPEFFRWVAGFGYMKEDLQFWDSIYKLSIGATGFNYAITNHTAAQAFYHIFIKLDKEKKYAMLPSICHAHLNNHPIPIINSLIINGLSDLEKEAEAAIKNQDQTKFATDSWSSYEKKCAFEYRLSIDLNMKTILDQVGNGVFNKIYFGIEINNALDNRVSCDLRSSDKEKQLRWLTKSSSRLVKHVSTRTAEDLRRKILHHAPELGFHVLRNFLLETQLSVLDKEKIALTKSLINEPPNVIADEFQSNRHLYDEELLRTELIKKLEERLPASPQKMVDSLLNGKHGNDISGFYPYPLAYPMMIYGR